MLALARSGLARRAVRDSAGKDETNHLDYLDRIVDEDRTSAEHWLERYHGAWGRRIDPIFEEARL
jgi:glutamate--cysteine ligase